MIDIEDKYTPPEFHDVLLAKKTIELYLRPTPVYTSPLLDDAFGFRAYIKCENLQPTGAFKVRGGINLMANLPEVYRRRGVITASSGNHGQSIAYAARLFDVPATVYVPEGTNPLKIRAMENLGADVVSYGPDYDTAREKAEEQAEVNGMYYVHGANEPYLIAGVGTAGLELIEEVPELDVLFMPIGGGSGASGSGLVVKTINPNLRLIGVQAEGADAVYQSWKANELLTRPKVTTFAEGLATRVAFRLTFRMLQTYLDDFVLVSDDELRSAIGFLLEMAHLLAEGAGAATTAAAGRLKGELAGKHVGIMLSGGNLNLARLKEMLNRA